MGTVPVLLVDTVPFVGAQNIRNYLKNNPEFSQNNVFKGKSVDSTNVCLIHVKDSDKWYVSDAESSWNLADTDPSSSHEKLIN